jgi:hypothetical protein
MADAAPANLASTWTINLAVVAGSIVSSAAPDRHATSAKYHSKTTTAYANAE